MKAVLTLALASLAISLLPFGWIWLKWDRTRANVKRARGDMRTMAIAAEVLMMDHNSYPDSTAEKKLGANRGVDDPKGLLDKIPTFMIIAVDLPNGSWWIRRQDGTLVNRPFHMLTRFSREYQSSLTTPVAYLDHYFTDPFAPVPGATYAYWQTENFPDGRGIGYIFWSPGPDGVYDLTIDNIAQAYTPAVMVPTPFLIERTYDPTNGAKSGGDVHWYKH